jgi:hypothetical protein
MENLTALFGFLLALSMATERITEIIKGAPYVCKWLAEPRPESAWESGRKATLQVLAIVVGTGFASQVPDSIASLTQQWVTTPGWPVYLLFGTLASGGSGMWNSLLDITRQAKQMKEELNKQLKAKKTGPLPVTQ